MVSVGLAAAATATTFAMRYTLLLITALALVTDHYSVVDASVSKGETTRKPPNILVLLTDDQDILLGGMDRMPNLRRYMIDRGVTFSNAYVHTPICCPSRSSILSGRYLHNGITKNNSVSGNCNGRQWQQDAEKKTFAVYAQQAGYRTSYAGKYLNAYGCQSSDNPECTRVPPGWDKWYGLVGNSRYYNATIVVSDDNGQTSKLVKHGNAYPSDYLPDMLCDRTLAMIREFTSSTTEDDNPFLIVNAWPTPHGPFTPAPWAEHAFDGAKAPRTPNWNASSKSMQQKHWLLRQLMPIDNNTEKLIDITFEHRLEALLSVDSHVGKIFELLEEKEELDNTIIIYTSDHGYQLGQHRLAIDKRHLYEHDIKVPFIAFSGMSKQALSRQDIVLNIDIAPTIYELTTGSSKIPETMDGSSFASLLYARRGNDNHGEFTFRDDFLISYHGEGFPPCGMAQCPLDPHGGSMPDSWNNTYHCVRTITQQVNNIYCQFEDDEKFVEYYDLNVDPWQLSNKCNELSPKEKSFMEERLSKLRTCRGENCRKKPALKSQAIRTT